MIAALSPADINYSETISTLPRTQNGKNKEPNYTTRIRVEPMSRAGIG